MKLKKWKYSQKKDGKIETAIRKREKLNYFLVRNSLLSEIYKSLSVVGSVKTVVAFPPVSSFSVFAVDGSDEIWNLIAEDWVLGYLASA